MEDKETFFTFSFKEKPERWTLWFCLYSYYISIVFLLISLFSLVWPIEGNPTLERFIFSVAVLGLGLFYYLILVRPTVFCLHKALDKQ